jgi:hypothetical protein
MALADEGSPHRRDISLRTLFHSDTVLSAVLIGER